MLTEERVRNLAESLLTSEQQFLVDVKVSPGNIVVLEVDDDEAIKIEDLAKLNRDLRDKLEEEGVDVELRVSSPGAGKPFKVQRQYTKHIGRGVVVELIEGKKLIGILEELKEGELGLRVEIPSKVKGRAAKLDKDLTYIVEDRIKATKAKVAFK